MSASRAWLPPRYHDSVRRLRTAWGGRASLRQRGGLRRRRVSRSAEGDKKPKSASEEIMARITRRKLLKLTGAGAVAATGGMAGILATGRAPAFAQAQTVHWLRWVDFVPASDQVLKKDIVAECEKALGIKMTVETINGNDLQARTTA